MNFLGYIKKSRFLSISTFIFIFLNGGYAQKSTTTELPNDSRYRTTYSPGFAEKPETVGSIYLSDKWMNGTLVLWDHSRIPAPGQFLLCNFDKVKSIIYVFADTNRLLYFPIDSVLSFDLAGNNKSYSFEKVPWISSSYYLMPMFTSAKGYSLYKRLFTKMIQADFTSGGYFTKGKKYDEYADFYEYYLTYPGNKDYQKMTLKERAIRRALKEESELVKEFFSLHETEFTEQSFLGLIQYIDDKKYPD